MTLNLDELNDNQRAAVLWGDGPMLVLAGPGSGKTKVLTMRAARLLQESPTASVLALTFTTKAADEMRERLDQLLGGRANRAHLCTFHSFAGDILRQHGSHIGFRPDFSLLTLEEDRIALLEEAINRLPEDSSSVPSDRRNLLNLVDRLFAESYDGGLSAPALGVTPAWMPILFQAYCDALRDSNRLDYGALLHFARQLLESRPAIARVLRLGWTYICVDEFQDTNRAQYDLLRLVVGGGKPNLFVVGDDDQILYQWNGASPERLQALQTDYAMEVIQLPQNYRCPAVIITLANNLIRHNQTRMPGKQALVAHRETDLANLVFANTFPDEAQEARAIPEMIKQRGLVPSDCVVLARSVKLLKVAAEALSAAGFSPYVSQRKNEFESAPARWMLAMLRLANARHDREFVRRACVEWNALTGMTVEVDDVEAASALVGGDFLRAWLEVVLVRENAEGFKTLAERVQKNLADRLDFLPLLDLFLKQNWQDDRLAEEEASTWNDLHGALLREQGSENLTLNLYLQEMDMKSKAPARPADAIPCLTVHGAKGLEFQHVFLVGMAEEVFPSYQAVKKMDSSREMEEERRNCFVAITRVQQSLTMTRAEKYNGYRKKSSRFLQEMGIITSQ
ncbi:MAG TPA: ATP-dependent helicase [Blastocatellia bacterium]|nr:ATP-dependent helicase [Blastocatellia bacterium]HMV82171.1 ATP-dependent helicase [Blastocatellia bacterium]HMX26168.1 ATP-dependent helicase [Blastocatellia bacterium]HMY71827.1 ATP-dependent helicase [Blastocatellia bacterium]HNG34614.1 ATP-dependent helicase [Blastocatellia bacterium]